MSIRRVKCRAIVEIGGIVVKTPLVQSFNVRKQRGQISTFDASLKIPARTSVKLAGGDVVIKAGENDANNTIFVGICRQAKVSPCFDDPFYVILSISGADKLFLLQGKKFTRRCRATDAAWCAITGVTRKGLKSGRFAYNTEPVLEMNEGRLEKQNNVTGPRSDNAADAVKPSTPPSSSKQKTVQLHVEIVSPTDPVTNSESEGE